MDAKAIEEYRRLLLARRAELEGLSASSSSSRAAVELDQSKVGRLSRMDALQGQAMAQATEERRRNERHRIEAALARMGEDEYGYCQRCGEEIAAARLRLDPATPLCVDCANSVARAEL
ncbi:TraR/DksA family transcriptional regulator [Oceanibacterium hippocampi]|uniref:RNA polymerase-binding transcription factor DksA n=1 Tax=Oceanibacterium hippocampi TaxID=745714 RepID=A0A1Y5RAP9_9PROT|nr:TraR/DksA C4-type zinc finger protein [Oceanibacterium hippocampi]SLN12655.1 RNA polymerase-binding transcription factor DksA [Oceanibacterium hippocampi]